MAKKRRAAPSPTLTTERAIRLCRLVHLLRTGPQPRNTLLRRLQLDMRGFYRDVQLLRDRGIVVSLHEGQYVLTGTADAAFGRLPLPDPQITVADAIQLSKGKSAAHRKLQALLEQIMPTA